MATFTFTCWLAFSLLVCRSHHSARPLYSVYRSRDAADRHEAYSLIKIMITIRCLKSSDQDDHDFSRNIQCRQMWKLVIRWHFKNVCLQDDDVPKLYCSQMISKEVVVARITIIIRLLQEIIFDKKIVVTRIFQESQKMKLIPRWYHCQMIPQKSLRQEN